MNEARRQAYLNLIESLLNCPSKEQNQILHDNFELVDAGLVQIMLERANDLRIDNKLDDANSLMTLAGHLMGNYNNTVINKWSPSTYIEFLMQVLQATQDSKGDRNVIYALLRDNLNLISDNLAAVLQNWARENLPNLDKKKQIYIIGVVGNFSNAIADFSLGSRASNLEIAIAGYEVALTVFTRQEYAENWAETQNNLGIAYLYRIRGKKAENLEIAIATYQASLQVYTREAFPENWAMTQNNFAVAYRNRIIGEKSDNLEISIAFYQESLEVWSREAFPENWATVKNNLGITYNERIMGEKAENLEKAIGFYHESLEVYTREAFPFEWARSQNNLAAAYSNRIRGEKVDNLEKAIATYEQSLEVYIREEYPKDWAGTKNNLANAYRDRIRGKKAENLEKAIATFQESLEVYTREAFPFEWANTQNNLANVYLYRIIGEKAENLEIAIVTYQESLEVYTREAFPFEWARSQNNLANAYRNRIRGKKAENLEMAISAYQAALSIYTREAFPINHAETLFNLGLAYQKNFQLSEAYNTFNSAIETVELMRSEIIIGGEADRQKLAEEWNKLYQSMVEVCLAMENSTTALEYVERSKTRNLVELFHKAHSLPSQVQRISFAEIRSLLAENEAILEWYITYNGFKVFIITRDSTEPDVLQSSYADLEELEKFQHEYINDIKDEEKYDNWRHQLETRLEKLSEILHIDEIIARLPENCQKLILVPFRYLHLFPLHAIPIKRHKPESQSEETGCLLELFPGGVRYTPSCQLLQLSQRLNPSSENASSSKFFAIQNPTEDLDFTDIEVEAIAKSFNPAEVLSRQQASKTAFQQQIASLQNADIAHFSCHGFFDFLSPQKSSLILAGAKIASDGVPSENKSYIRSRRGESFDIEKCLTLEEIFDLPLSKCSLVTLSACETGLTDIRDSTDEYIGLPSGFLYAGTTNVISTLWAVNDVSTAILMIKFYEIFLSESRPPVAIALRESQLWLRSLTVKDLLEWVEASQLLSREHKQKIQDKYRRGYKQDYQPYESPVYWAAFCAVGQ